MHRLTGVGSVVSFTAVLPAFAYTIPEVRYAALDQPQINVTIRASADGPQLTYPRLVVVYPEELEFDEIDSINIPFYFDTGAGASLMSSVTAQSLGLAPVQVDPDGDGPLPATNVIATDVGIGGNESFHLTQQLWIGLAPVNEYTDVENLASYTQQFGPQQLHLQIPGTTPDNDLPPDIEGLLQSGFDVLGMPYFAGKTVVMDLRPSNAFVAESGDEFEGAQFQMRTYVYNPGEAYRPGTLDSDPGIVPVDATVKLSYGDFGGFSTVSPAGATGPTVAHNPFVGTAPVSDSTGPAEEAPQAAIRFGDDEVRASLLFDTGGSVSLLSTAMVEGLGITVLRDANNHPIGFQRAGALLDTFSVAVEGVGGVVELHGLYLEGLVIPTEQGDPNNLDDPRHLHFGAAPFFVIDLSVVGEDGTTVTLDGVLGMNYLAPSAEITYLDLGGGFQLPFPFAETTSGFDWLTFDETAGRLGVSFVPEPTSLAAVSAIGALGAFRRRRGR